VSITVTVTARLHRSGKIYWMSQVCVGLQNLWWYYFCCVYPTLSCDLLSDEWVIIVGVGGVLLGCLHTTSEVYGDLECLSGLERKLFFKETLSGFLVFFNFIFCKALLGVAYL